jgi:hypothetical protein
LIALIEGWFRLLGLGDFGLIRLISYQTRQEAQKSWLGGDWTKVRHQRRDAKLMKHGLAEVVAA